jgi:hypothetical protein
MISGCAHAAMLRMISKGIGKYGRQGFWLRNQRTERLSFLKRFACRLPRTPSAFTDQLRRNRKSGMLSCYRTAAGAYRAKAGSNAAGASARAIARLTGVVQD